MAKKETNNVTMRVRIGENELEVSGPKDFVKKEIDAFKKEQKVILPVISSSSGPKLKQEIVGALKITKQMSVNQFFRKIPSKTDVDRTLIASYYLEKYRNYENFTASDVREIIKESRNNPPRNTNDSINSNIRKGLIMAAGDREGKRAFVLTTDGEDAINEMLKE